MKTFLAFIGGSALVVGAIVYGAYAWGYVLFKFWGWFLLPLFTGLPAITIHQSIGLMFMVGLFRNHDIKSSSGDDDLTEKITNAVVAIILPWVTLFVASFFN